MWVLVAAKSSLEESSSLGALSLTKSSLEESCSSLEELFLSDGEAACIYRCFTSTPAQMLAILVQKYKYRRGAPPGTRFSYVASTIVQILAILVLY